MRRGILTIAVLATTFLVAVSGADAKTVLVAKGGENLPGCGTGAGAPCLTVDYAVSQRAVSGDTVSIGPGDFDGVATSKNVALVGAGAGGPGAFDGSRFTRIRSTTPDFAAVALNGGGSVTGLRVEGQAPAGTYNPGLRLEGSAAAPAPVYSVADSLLIGGKGGPALLVAIDGMSNPTIRATVTGSRMEGPGGAVVDAGDSTGRVKLGIADSVIDGPGVALELFNADLVLERSTASGATGIDQFNGDLSVDRSRVRGTARGGVSITGGSNGAHGTISNSLIEGAWNMDNPSLDAAVRVLGSGSGPASLDLIGSTVVGGGLVDAAVGMQAEPTAASANIRDSVLTGDGLDLVAQGTAASATATHSAFAQASGAVPAVGSETNIGGNPGLGPTFAPLAGSPLIDRGDPADFPPGSLDLAGVPRGGAPDIGAFEYVPPAVRNVAPVLTSVSMTNKVFAPKPKAGGSAKKRKPKRGTTFRYRLSEPGKVTITIERKLAGRRVKVKGKTKCVAPKRSNRRKRRCSRWKRAGTLTAAEKAGKQSTAFSGRFKGRALKPGSYRARIRETDAQGAKSKERILSFRVVRG